MNIKEFFINNSYKVKRLIFLIFLISTSAAAQKLNFKRFTAQDGLSISQITSILQNKDGYLFIGTGGGLNIFDGNKFKVYNTGNGLVDNNVNNLVSDDNNNIWIGTDKGLSKFDGYSFVNYTREDGLPGNTIWSLFYTNDGKILIGTNNGFCIYDNGNFITFTDPIFENHKAVWSIYKDSKGLLWLGVEGGIINYDGNQFWLNKWNNSIRNKAVFTFCESHEGSLWIGTEDNVYTLKDEKLTNINRKWNVNLKSNWIIKEDSDRNIWIGSDGKLSKISKSKITTYNKNNGFSEYQVWAICQDNEKNMWFGTDGDLFMLTDENYKMYDKLDGKDINAWSIKQNKNDDIWILAEKFKVLKFHNNKLTYVNIPGLKNISGLTYMLVDRKNNLWFGADNFLLKYDYRTLNKIKFKTDYYYDGVQCLLEDSNGKIWFGTVYSGVFNLEDNKLNPVDKSIGLNSLNVFYLFRDSKGNLWAGTGNGINKYENDKWITPETLKKLNRYSIININEDLQGNLWFGTYEIGVVKYSPKSNLFDTLSTKDGLNDNSVLTISFDGNGGMWIGTNKGLNKFDLRTYNQTGKKIIIPFNRYDGFAGTELIQNAALKDKDGNMWFGTVKGLLKFDPLKLKLTSTPPLVHITGLSVFSSNFEELKLDRKTLLKFSKDEALQFDHDYNNISIDFIGINLSNPYNAKYSYRFNKGMWSKPTKSSKITFHDLSSGKYEFEVRAENKYNVWSTKTAKVNFNIATPFWETIWFYVLLGFLVMYLTYLFFTIRINHIKKMNRDLEERISERLKFEEKLKLNKLELQKAKTKAEKSDKLKSEFLAQMSHEIRTPINSILSFSNLIQDELKDKLDSELKEGFEIVNSGSRRLIRTIDSILNMSRIQTGNIDLTPDRIKICEILEDLKQEFVEIAKSKSIDFKTNYKITDCYVYADNYTVTQLFANLIDNAVKYTINGKIEITIYELDDKICVDIKDTGIGMSKDFINNLFKPFTQEDGGYTRKFEGNGLGLALVKNYCELNNAEINVKSEKGKGSIFTVAFSNEIKKVNM